MIADIMLGKGSPLAIDNQIGEIFEVNVLRHESKCFD
jgi:hypothetical protein